MILLRKAATVWGWPGLVGAEVLAQFAGVWPPLVIPQYMVMVGLSPPVFVTFPFNVAVVEAMLEAALMVTVGVIEVVVKLKEAAGHEVPALLVALAEK